MNIYYKLVSLYYKGLRDLFSLPYLYDPIKSISYDMRKQRWENKING